MTQRPTAVSTSRLVGVTTLYYLRDGFLLATSPGPGPKKTIDVGADRARNGNPFKPFGTWSITLP